MTEDGKKFVLNEINLMRASGGTHTASGIEMALKTI